MSSNQAGSSDSDRRSRIIHGTISVVSGCFVCAVGAALFWKKIRVALKPVPDDLGWFWGALIAASIFLLVALFVYFVAKRTLWELAGLLIIPLALVGVGLWFTAQQDARQQQIEEQRAQDLALLGYLDQMSTLLLEDLNDPKVRTMLQARTLAVLRRLDTSRKEEVIRYLVDAELVQQTLAQQRADVSQKTADVSAPIIALSGAKLNGVNLNGADLYGADLSHADLSHAVLSEANLFVANLSFANLRHTNLSDANLLEANLVGADLSGAEGITNEELERQAWSLEEATMRNGQKYEEWLKSKGRSEEGENSSPF